MRPPSALALLAAAATAAVVEAQQGAYSQRGGTVWAGPTTCVSGLKCVILSLETSTTATTPPTATLTPNNLWIRAVEEPNYHAYLQSSSSSAAILGPASTAAQFIFNGGRIILLPPSSAPALRAVVHPEVIGPGAGRLAVTFVEWGSATADYGGFLYSGDTLMWRNLGLEVPRPDEAAWLVCAGQELFINLGGVGEAPEGCVDQTASLFFRGVRG
ncbi:hypothetical protein VE02_05153 [Pseudogymnoascus sp. 03VT05]|nr:hypothetical protein VE02_05153 [Pseudogymnoascus sp. 03VT05]